MKKNSPPHETPPELKGITEILEKSLSPHAEEEAPPMPDDLRQRLRGQYGDLQTSSRVEATSTGFWGQLRILFAQPAVIGSLAAVVLVGVLMSLLMGPSSQGPTEVMRGTPGNVSSEHAIIILFSLPEDQALAVKDSGYFEEKHLHVTDSAEELADWVAQDGVSIVVDGAIGEIRHEDGRQVPLPDEGISDAVVQFLSE